jgi:hypothetical protein
MVMNLRNPIISTSWLWVFRVAVLVTVLPVVAVAQMQSIEIETEDFTAFNDVGGLLIQKVGLSGCSGGFILIGLDSPGEWAQYSVTPPGFGYFSFMLTGRGDYGVEYGFRLIFTPTDPGGGTAQTVEFSFMGQGYG